MKSWIILIGLAVALTAAATAVVALVPTGPTTNGPAYPAPAKPDGPSPELVVEEDTTFEFGVLPQEKTGKHSWVFKNNGAGTLEVKGMSSSCSCTTSDLFVDNKKVGKEIQIKPGESRAIEVSFNTKKVDGKYRQTVTIGTNDPKRPEITLAVEGTIHPAIMTYPVDPSFSYGSVNNEKPMLRKVAIYSADRPAMKLTRLTSSNPVLIGVEAVPLTPEERQGLKVEGGHTIEVTLKPTTHLGAFAEEILVETDHPSQPELRFKVTGKVAGSITTVPERISVRDANSSDGGSEVITVVSQRPEVHFTVAKKPAGMDVAFEPIPAAPNQKGSKYKMIVSVIPGTESGRIVDEIVVKTDDPRASEFKLPVDVLVQGSK